MIFEVVKYTRFNERIMYIEPNGTKYYKPIKTWDGSNPLHTIIINCILLITKGYKKKCINIIKKVNKETINVIITSLEDLVKRMKEPRKKYILSSGSTVFLSRKNYGSVFLLLKLCKGLL